jgi:hypothetical protein
MLAPVYHACAARDMTPRDVDDLLLWEAAAVLGVGAPTEPVEAQKAPDGVRFGELRPDMVKVSR